MKHLKVFEYLGERELKKNKFVSYFLSFYAPNAIYGEFFDYKLTQKDVEDHVDKFIAKRGLYFDGDSSDRELFRDIMFVKLGICDINKVETNVQDFFTKYELKKLDLLYKANKYNL